VDPLKRTGGEAESDRTACGLRQKGIGLKKEKCQGPSDLHRTGRRIAVGFGSTPPGKGTRKHLLKEIIIPSIKPQSSRAWGATKRPGNISQSLPL